MKKGIKIVLIVLAVVVVLAGGFLAFLSITEYRPDAVEPVRVSVVGNSETPGDSISVLSWNIGYCGLGKNESFVMDGGTGSGKPTDENFDTYYNGVLATLADFDADIYMLQEVDENSARSRHYDMTRYFPENLSQYSSAFALNYSCPFVPFPWPPMGQINGGIMTMTDFTMQGGEAERIALPCPFSWPLRTANLKRCLLVSRIVLPDTEKELVMVNLHLEAYDSGEGKAAQTAMLMDFIESEYEKGNYVIAGGDFNQTFPGGLEAFPMQSADLWAPGALSEADLPEGFSFAYDTATASCRSLDRPLDTADPNFQYYIIDGFILSPNVTMESVETQPLDFQYSDHNPLLLRVTLEP